jgi:hypothetical protein
MVVIQWHCLETSREKEKSNRKREETQTMKKTLGTMIAAMVVVI